MAERVRPVAVTLVVSLLLLGLGFVTSPAGAKEVHPEWGSTSAPDGVLKRGCKSYSYSYALTPPKGDWALETFIVGPKGKRLASGAFMVNLDKLADTATYRLCKPTTRPGTFKIKAKVSVLDGDELTEGWLPITRFRLRAPS